MLPGRHFRPTRPFITSGRKHVHKDRKQLGRTWTTSIVQSGKGSWRHRWALRRCNHVNMERRSTPSVDHSFYPDRWPLFSFRCSQREWLMSSYPRLHARVTLAFPSSKTKQWQQTPTSELCLYKIYSSCLCCHRTHTDPEASPTLSHD